MAPTTDMDFTKVDFYELLSIAPTSNESEIRRAYRKTSRLYHPDKVTPTPETLEKFQQLQYALEILTDTTERSKYDASRNARQKRATEHAAMEDKRRKMKEDLERREGAAAASVNGLKRKWTDRELEMNRIAEQNRKLREAATLKKREEFIAAQTVTEEPGNEMSKAVKVRWIREGDGLDIDDVALVEMFPTGEVDTVVLLKDKKRKVDGRDKKVVMGTAVLMFNSLSAAKKAVAKGSTEELQSIVWAEKDKESEPV